MTKAKKFSLSLNVVFLIFRKHFKELLHNNPLQQIQANCRSIHVASTVTESQGKVASTLLHQY